MSLQIALALALAAATTTEPPLCSGVEREIEPDMRVLETDLDRYAALAAAEKLRGMISKGELGGEFHLGALNQLKIIQGHVLLQQALSDRKEFGASSTEAGVSTKAFCDWLGKEGFWYD